MGWLNENSRILTNVSNNVVINLVINYALIVGCIGGVCLYASFPLFYYKFGVSAEEYQNLVTIAFLSLQCKALVGAISDTVPIFGWHKRWYLIMANLVLCGALIGAGYSETYKDAVGFLILAATSIMINNTLWEGQYANMVSFTRADPRGISFSWGMYMVGLGLGSCIVGPLGDKTGDKIHLAFFITAPIALLPIIPLIFIPDSTLPGDRKGAATTPTLLSSQNQPEGDVDALRANLPTRKEWGLVIWISGSSVLLIIILLFMDDHSATTALGLCVVIVSVSVISVCTIYRDNRLFVVTCVYSLFHQLFWTNIQGALDSFYTAGPLCFHDGPNFDLVFYYTVVQIVSSVVGMGAAGLHAGVFSKWDIRSAEINAIVFRIATGLFDLVIIQRWNKR